MATRIPRPESTLPAWTLTWLNQRPRAQRRFVLAVWAELAELERFDCPTAPIDALRSVLLDHQPARRGRCYGCPRVWIPRRRRFPCKVWAQIGMELLGHPEDRGRHRLPDGGTS